jgi:hypothetical protein
MCQARTLYAMVTMGGTWVVQGWYAVCCELPAERLPLRAILCLGHVLGRECARRRRRGIFGAGAQNADASDIAQALLYECPPIAALYATCCMLLGVSGMLTVA